MTDIHTDILEEQNSKFPYEENASLLEVRQAIKAGYLINDESIRGKAKRLRIGDPIPTGVGTSATTPLALVIDAKFKATDALFEPPSPASQRQ